VVGRDVVGVAHVQAAKAEQNVGPAGVAQREGAPLEPPPR